MKDFILSNIRIYYLSNLLKQFNHIMHRHEKHKPNQYYKASEIDYIRNLRINT